LSGPLIENVSDTARWVAVYRAMETERPDAHFRDPYARRLAGERGFTIARTVPAGKASAWAMIVRTCLFDELILRTVERDGADTVINLAAGLDARPYRLALPPALRWIEVDLPQILAEKEQALSGERPVCTLERVPLDLADEAARQALFARVGAEARRVMVLSEGLLVYLDPEHARTLAVDLHAQESFRWWLMDLSSPQLIKMLERRWKKTLEKAPFRFGPAEGAEFFRPFGWRPLEVRSLLEEARRLRREMPFAPFYRLLGLLASKKRREGFRAMSTTNLLERA